MKLLFTSGTARGGTNLRTLTLNNHSAVRMTLDPFIPLFRFYRDSLLKSVGALHLLDLVPSTVLDDYYHSDAKLAVFKAMQAADPDIPFAPHDWPALRATMASRLKVASVNLIPHLDLLPAPTFREVFRNTMKVVAAPDPRTELEWVGFNDNWTAEFLPLIARLDPEAKFMLHLRDPRAVINSSEFAEPNPAKRPTVVSFARGVRKYLALAAVLPADPYLKRRLLISQYEQYVAAPELETRRMTDFLGVAFEPEMLDVSRFKKADGTQWPADPAIYRSSVGVWREEMPKPMAELVECVCDPEMRLHGYLPEVYNRRTGLSDSALAFAYENARDCLGWRTDFPEIEHTIGAELYRQRVLEARGTFSQDGIERSFLFPDVYEQVSRL